MRPRNDHSSITDIVKRVRRFNQLELLERISLLASQLDEEPARAKQFIRHDKVGRLSFPRRIIVSTHCLTALAKIVLGNGNKWPLSSPSMDDVIFLENQVSNLPSFFTTEPPDNLLLEQVFFQLAKQQFRFQTGPDLYAFGRSIKLYRDIPKLLESEGTSPPVNVNSKFEQVTGMSLIQFIWTGLLVWGASKQGKTFSSLDLETLTNEVKDRWLGEQQDLPTLDTVRHFLDYVSLDINGFANKIGDLRNQDERFIAVDFQPLLQYPVVRTGDDRYIVPTPKLLIDRFTDGIFHDLANSMKGSGAENPFREYFGKLFERYVGLQLSLVFDAKQLYPEKAYGRESDGKRTPDWTVNDPNLPLAIECRSSTFRLETQKYADLDEIAKDLGRIGVETVTRIWPKIQDVVDGHTHISLDSKTNPLPVLCTFESLEPIGMLGAFIRGQLRSPSGDEPPNFYLVPVRYLEAMCATENLDDFYYALKKLEVDVTWHDPTDEGPQTRWERVMPDPMPKNRLLMDAVNELWSICSGFQSTDEADP